LANELISDVISKKRTEGDSFQITKTKECVEFYKNLDKEDKIKFLRVLYRNFGGYNSSLILRFCVPREKSVEAAQRYINSFNEDPYGRAAVRAEMVLRHSMIPSHDAFFDHMVALPGGTKFLVDMRADLLQHIRENNHDVGLTALNEYLKHKLASWLLGNITLRRITWDSPGSILENLTKYEAVHVIKDWKDLKRRVGSGRRLFAFFHSEMPHDPLIFINVALVKELTGDVLTILKEPSPGASLKYEE
ncbi:18777_t:CDS:2, partial [Acaulospora morrowiae]